MQRRGCEAIQLLLSKYADGEGTTSERQRVADHVPDGALLERQPADIFRKQVDLDAGMGPIGHVVAFGASRHRPVVGSNRHRCHNSIVDVIRKNVPKHQMRERRLAGLSGID